MPIDEQLQVRLRDELGRGTPNEFATELKFAHGKSLRATRRPRKQSEKGSARFQWVTFGIHAEEFRKNGAWKPPNARWKRALPKSVERRFAHASHSSVISSEVEKSRDVTLKVTPQDPCPSRTGTPARDDNVA